MKIVVTGASGNGGISICEALLEEGYTVRMADVTPPPISLRERAEFVRCDTRTSSDVRNAIRGMDGVVHLAAWHGAHRPPVSHDTLFAVNVEGTYNVLELCSQEGVQSIVYASSMAYGWRSVYGVTKVIGEELCRCYHEMTGASIAMLRYHEFIPRPYLEFGERLLRNGVDRRDVVSATLAAVRGTLDKRITLFRTTVHTNHGMPEHVIRDFRRTGPDWCEQQMPGSIELIRKYRLSLPEQVEQHDLQEAKVALEWEPRIGFLDFMRDLKARDERGDDVRSLLVPSEIPMI